MHVRVSHKSLTVAGHQTGAQPWLQVLILETLIDMNTALQQGLHRLGFVQEDERSHADPKQVNVAELLSPLHHLLEEL